MQLCIPHSAICRAADPLAAPMLSLWPYVERDLQEGYQFKAPVFSCPGNGCACRPMLKHVRNPAQCIVSACCLGASRATAQIEGSTHTHATLLPVSMLRSLGSRLHARLQAHCSYD